MKKILSLILAMALIICAVPMGAFAFTVSAATTSGTTGDCTWTLDGTVLTISGNGKMGDYSSGSSLPWGTSITKVIFKDGVTYIGSRAFYSCDYLTDVSIAKTVTSVGRDAFMNSSDIENVYITDLASWCNIEFIVDWYQYGDNPLYYAENLYLNGKILSGDIVLPNSVKRLGSGVFYGCSEITSITIPNSVTRIDDWVFWGCTGLTSVEIPDSVTQIGKWAFYNCDGLKNIKIGTGVKKIGGSAFADCNYITSITLPAGVTEIGEAVFKNCYRLTNISINGDNDYYCLIDGVLFDKAVSCVLCYPCGKTDSSYRIPNTVTRVGDGAFYNCDSLTNVIIPDSVTFIRDEAFAYCNKLTSITLGKGIEYLNWYVFYGSGLKDVYYAGNETDKNKIDMSMDDNPTILKATWHYNMLYPDATTNDWYSDSVKYARDNGIMSGYSNGKFGTSDSIQRQDFLVMLARLDGVNLDDYKGNSKFPDVAKNSYYQAAVNWGAEKGIVTGYNNGKFGVGDKVTREQLVTFLYRYAKYKGYDFGYTSDSEKTVSNQYSDYKNVSGFAKDPVLWAIEKGVISGKTSSTIVPQGNAQRCEVAKIMYNIFLNDIFK